MYAIDEFLKIDNDNIAESKKVLNKIHEKSLFSIELCASILQDLAETFGKKYLYDKYEKVFKDWAKDFYLSIPEAYTLLKKATVLSFNNKDNDKTSEAKKALDNIFSNMSRIYLLMRLKRDFFLGMAELLRLRYTTAISFYRLQTESFALIKYFSDNPHVAQEWIEATTEEKGKKFYINHHSNIVKILKDQNIYDEYNKASGFSMHSRILGIASGLLIGDKMKEEGKPKETILVYNEIDDPITLFIWFINYLKFHEKLIKKVRDVIPEFTEEDRRKINTDKFSKILNILSNKLFELRNKK